MDGPLVIQGRTLRSEDVARIRDWLQAHPGSNRTRLSRELCVAWDWRNGAGRLKDMAARSLLLKLEARGHIQLPPRRTASVNGLRNGRLSPLEHDPRVLEGPLRSLQPVRVQPVLSTGSEARLFQFLLQRYHYLGHRNCVGENLKYLARDREGRPLACLLFGSAAWKSAPRDQWIGWNAQQHRRHLSRLTNNTRFLILPWVKVPGLASHLLARVAPVVSADWEKLYQHPIYLLETFIDPERFRGSCYRAANWIYLGQTTGRGKADLTHRANRSLKQLWVYPVRKDFRQQLCQSHGG